MVRSKIILTKGNPYNTESFDIQSTYSMTIRDYQNRMPDMEIVFDDGQRMTIIKEYMAGIVELKAVRVEKGEEMNLKPVDIDDVTRSVVKNGTQEKQDDRSEIN